MVLPYLKGSSLYILGVFHGECLVSWCLRSIFEVLWWILSYIFEFLLQPQEPNGPNYGVCKLKILVSVMNK
jgi:hypothetical protein